MVQTPKQESQGIHVFIRLFWGQKEILFLASGNFSLVKISEYKVQPTESGGLHLSCLLANTQMKWEREEECGERAACRHITENPVTSHILLPLCCAITHASAGSGSMAYYL